MIVLFIIGYEACRLIPFKSCVVIVKYLSVRVFHIHAQSAVMPDVQVGQKGLHIMHSSNAELRALRSLSGAPDFITMSSRSKKIP